MTRTRFLRFHERPRNEPDRSTLPYRRAGAANETIIDVNRLERIIAKRNRDERSSDERVKKLGETIIGRLNNLSEFMSLCDEARTAALRARSVARDEENERTSQRIDSTESHNETSFEEKIRIVKEKIMRNTKAGSVERARLEILTSKLLELTRLERIQRRQSTLEKKGNVSTTTRNVTETDLSTASNVAKEVVYNETNISDGDASTEINAAKSDDEEVRSKETTASSTGSNDTNSTASTKTQIVPHTTHYPGCGCIPPIPSLFEMARRRKLARERARRKIHDEDDNADALGLIP